MEQPLTRRLRWLALLLVCVGCARPAPVALVGVSSDSEPPPASPHQAPPSQAEPVPADIVARSELPFRAVRSADGEVLAPEAFFDELAERDVVCLAEDHMNPHHHWAQLYVVQELARRALTSGREVGLGLEMFQRPFQKALNDYASGKLSADELLLESEYEERWGYPFAYYAPQMDHLVARGGTLVALNAPRHQVKTVARQGFEGLTRRERRLLGGYDLQDEEHRALFDALMAHHPHHAGAPDQLYAAQVLWDETMAQHASLWLQERLPARQMIVLAGSAHCHASAIPRRIQRRVRARVVGIKLVVTSDADANVELQGYDYGFVMSPP